MKNILRFLEKLRKKRKGKYYITNFRGDIIISNLTDKEAENYIKNCSKEKLYIQEELYFG